MRTSLITTIVLMATLAGAVPGTKAASIFESDAELTPGSEIDKLVLDRLQQLGIQPARVCSDEVFVRRVYLDVIGTLPTSDEAREFLKDQDPQKRRALIDRLLEREEFADYWAMKWGDLLRVKAEFPINLWPNAVQAYHRWIRTSIKENVPYDRFVREMLTANGSNFRVGQVNFYRAMQNKTPEGVAEAVALSFMGVRADKWPKDKLAGLAAFFSKNRYKPTTEWKEEIVFFDPRKAADEPGVIGRESLTPEGQPTPTAAAKPMPGPIEAVFPDGERVTIPPEQDPRSRVCRLVDHRGKPVVCPQSRQSGVVMAAWPRHHSRTGRYPPGQPTRQPRIAELPGKGIHRPQIRSQTSAPTDPQFADLSTFLGGKIRLAGGTSTLCELSVAATRSRSPDRRPEPDHGDDGKLLERGARAIHLRSRGISLDCTARR